MKKVVILFLPWMVASSLMAQESVQMQMTNGENVLLPGYAVDTMVSSPQEHRVQMSYPKSEISTFSFSPKIEESAVNLDKADLHQSDNLLRSVSFLKKDNGALPYDIVVDAIDKKNLKLVIPSVASLSSAIPSFDASASYIYVNGKKWSEGDKIDLSKVADVKLVAFNGDVHSYTLQVVTSKNPLLTVKAKEEVTSQAWAKESSMKIGTTDLGTMSFKGKGKHFASGLKNNYRIKFDSKKSLLEMTKNKRWELVSLDGDPSLMRAALAYEFASSLSGLAWTPNYRKVDFLLNDTYMGPYLLVEQVRVCKGRLEGGYFVSIQDSYDEGEDFFFAKISNMLFVMKDPETGSRGAGLIRVQDKVNDFEKLLYSNGDYSAMIDMQSFVDFYLINEIMKDEDAFATDCHLNVREDGVIAMGPVSCMNKSFGFAGVSPEGFVRDRSPWFVELCKSPSFESLMKKRFAEIYAKKGDWLDKIDEWFEEGLLQAATNTGVWSTLDAKSDDLSDQEDAYRLEVSNMKTWLEKRLEWMKSELE